MRRIKAISFAAAVLVFMFAYFFFSARNRASREEIKVAGVIVEGAVAKTDIEPYKTITGDMVEMQRIAVPEGDTDYFASIEDVVGKITTARIYSGEKLTNKRAVDEDSPLLGVAPKIEAGKRAVGIYVDAQSGVGFNLKPGNYVDVVSSGKFDSGESNLNGIAGAAFSLYYGSEGPDNSVVFGENIDDNFAFTAIQDVKVLAVGANDDTEVTVKGKYDYVTLEVTPVQAEILTLLRGKGSIVSLIMRPHDEHGNTHHPRTNVFETYDPARIEQEAAEAAASSAGDAQSGQAEAGVEEVPAAVQ